MAKRRYQNLKTFSLLAKRAYKQSKKNNLGWSWHDAQRFTSANIYPEFKGQAPSRIKVTQVDKLFGQTLDIDIPISARYTVPEVCYNPFHIPTSELEDINWWMIVDAVQSFDPDLKIAVELDGFINTGIVKKRDLPNLVSVREEMRKSFSGVGSNSVYIIFKIVVIPGRRDDRQACSYYVLVTFEGSRQDMGSMDNEVVSFVTEEQLPDDVQTKRLQERERKQNELEGQSSKKDVKNRLRPSKVENKPESKKSKEQKSKYEQLNITLKLLKDDFDAGILTKKQYAERQAKILDKFERGGKL